MYNYILWNQNGGKSQIENIYSQTHDKFMKRKQSKYRIYSNNYFILGPWGWALIRGEQLFEGVRLYFFQHFQQVKANFETELMLLLFHAGLVPPSWGWALININVLGFKAGHLFKVSAYLKVGPYSNKYSKYSKGGLHMWS